MLYNELWLNVVNNNQGYIKSVLSSGDGGGGGNFHAHELYLPLIWFAIFSAAGNSDFSTSQKISKNSGFSCTVFAISLIIASFLWILLWQYGPWCLIQRYASSVIRWCFENVFAASQSGKLHNSGAK